MPPSPAPVNGQRSLPQGSDLPQRPACRGWEGTNEGPAQREISWPQRPQRSPPLVYGAYSMFCPRHSRGLQIASVPHPKGPGPPHLTRASSESARQPRRESRGSRCIRARWCAARLGETRRDPAPCSGLAAALRKRMPPFWKTLPHPSRCVGVAAQWPGVNGRQEDVEKTL